MKIYLGGCISHYHSNNELYKAIDWRNEFTQKLLDLNAELCDTKFDWFDPTYNFKENLQYSNKSIVAQNIHYLNECDIMVVNLDKLEYSPGTMFEMYYYYLKHKPVFAFGDSKAIEQPHVNCSITAHFKSIDDIIKHLKHMYIQ